MFEQVIEWSSEDSANLRNFLATETGRRLGQLLAQSIPKPADGVNQGRTLVSAGEVRGYNTALETIFSLVETRISEAVTENYPSLEDDSAWETPT